MNEKRAQEIFMKQVVFLVTIQVPKDGSGPISTTDVQDFLRDKGVQCAEVFDCTNYSEIEMRSLQVVAENPEYFKKTKMSMVRSDNDLWSRTTSTSSILYAEGK